MIRYSTVLFLAGLPTDEIVFLSYVLLYIITSAIMVPGVHDVGPEVEAQSRYPTIVAVAMTQTSLMTAIVPIRVYIMSFESA